MPVTGSACPGGRSAAALVALLALGGTFGCDGAGVGFVPLPVDAGFDLATEAPRDLAGQGGAPDLATGLRYTQSVSVIVEPDAGSAPILAAIRNAKSSILVEVYLLTDSSITAALVAARKAGRTVKVILEMNPNASSNNTAYSALLSGGVAVKWASKAYTFTHAKTLLIDGATLYAMTLNLSVSAFTDNREFALVDTDPVDVAEAQAIFDADWALAATPPIASLLVSPTTARKGLDRLIASATQRLDIQWEALSDPQIALRIQERVKAGVRTSILVPGNVLGTASQQVLNALKGAGATVKILDNPYIHSKMILVDRARGFIGSENGTANSLDNNREVGVLWENVTVARTVATTFDADWNLAKPF